MRKPWRCRSSRGRRRRRHRRRSGRRPGRTWWRRKHLWTRLFSDAAHRIRWRGYHDEIMVSIQHISNARQETLLANQTDPKTNRAFGDLAVTDDDHAAFSGTCDAVEEGNRDALAAGHRLSPMPSNGNPAVRSNLGLAVFTDDRGDLWPAARASISTGVGNTIPLHCRKSAASDNGRTESLAMRLSLMTGGGNDDQFIIGWRFKWLFRYSSGWQFFIHQSFGCRCEDSS